MHYCLCVTAPFVNTFLIIRLSILYRIWCYYLSFHCNHLKCYSLSQQLVPHHSLLPHFLFLPPFPFLIPSLIVLIFLPSFLFLIYFLICFLQEYIKDAYEDSSKDLKVALTRYRSRATPSIARRYMEELKAQVNAFKHTVRPATEVDTMIETAELIWCCKRWRATIMKWHCRTAITANRHVAADEHLRAKLMKRYLCYLWKVTHGYSFC